MKNKIFVIIALLFVLASCSKDLLNTDLLNKGTVSTFYKTESDAQTALVGCYDGLQRNMSQQSIVLVSEVLSDNCFAGGGNNDSKEYSAMDQFDKSVAPAQQNIFEGCWSDYYATINRCNMLLNKLDNIAWATDGLRNKIEAQAKFIRAYSYFDLTRMFGKVPLLKVSSADNIPQAPIDSIYQLIGQDLNFAVKNADSTSFSNMAVGNYGRITKWAAEGLLARVFLYYTGRYSKADLVGVVNKATVLSYLEDAIAKSGYGLVTNFADLWPASSLNKTTFASTYAGENNKEVVFSIKYTYTSNYNGSTDGNHWVIMMGLRGASISPYHFGWGFGAVNAKLWNAYSRRDERRGASIISIGEEQLKFEKFTDTREYTGYWNKKYTPLLDAEGNSLPELLGGVNYMIGQYQDYFVLRYSDILLMAAEMGSANAQDYFDQVRKRAYKANFTQIGITQAAIMEERRFEFAFEGIRYWDLLRQGLSVAKAAIDESGVDLVSGGVKDTKVVNFKTEMEGLLQIPINQITLSNGVLKQNTGW